jgi:hypothetical protein
MVAPAEPRKQARKEGEESQSSHSSIFSFLPASARYPRCGVAWRGREESEVERRPLAVRMSSTNDGDEGTGEEHKDSEDCRIPGG